MSSFNVSDSVIAVQMSMEKAIESVLTMLAAQDLNVDQEAYPLLSASQKKFLLLKGIVSKNETEKIPSEVGDDSWVEDELNESTHTAVEAEEKPLAYVMAAIEQQLEEEKEALFLFQEAAGDGNRLFCYRFFNMTSAELEEEFRRRRGNLCNSSEVKTSDESDLMSDDYDLNESTNTAVETEEELPAVVMTAIEQEKEEKEKEKLRLESLMKAAYQTLPKTGLNSYEAIRWLMSQEKMAAAAEEEGRRLRRALLRSPSELKISDHSECSDESDLESDDDEEETESETGSESGSEEETESEETDSEEESEESAEEDDEEEKELEQEVTLTAEAETNQAATSEVPEAPKTNTDRWADELSNMKNLKSADQLSLLERMMAEMKKAWF